MEVARVPAEGVKQASRILGGGNEVDVQTCAKKTQEANLEGDVEHT